MLVVGRELARAFDARVVRAVDAVEAVVGVAAALAAVVAAHLTRFATVRANAVVAMAATFAAAVGVFFAFDVALAAGGRVTAVARVASADGVEAAPFDAGVYGAQYVVGAVGGRAAGAARGATVEARTAFFAVTAARGLTALASRADPDRAGVVVGVALLVGAAFVGAAGVGAAALGGVAERVKAERAVTAVGGAGAAVVAARRGAGLAGFLIEAAFGQRTVVACAAAGQAGLVLTSAGEADVLRARDAVVTVRAFATLAAVAFAALLICGAFGDGGAHAILAADVLRTGVMVAAVFGAAAASQDRAAGSWRPTVVRAR